LHFDLFTIIDYLKLFIDFLLETENPHFPDPTETENPHFPDPIETENPHFPDPKGRRIFSFLFADFQFGSL
jgi:hypothetical protein